MLTYRSSAFGLGSDVELQEILCPPVLHMGSIEEKRKSFENQAVVRWFWVVLDHAEEFGEGIPNPRTKMMTESVKGYKPKPTHLASLTN